MGKPAPGPRPAHLQVAGPALLFLVALCLPLCTLGYRTVPVNVGPLQVNVRSELQAPFPPLRTRRDWLAFPRGFRDYVGTNFGFRADLIRAYARLCAGRLGSTTTPRVIIGKHGWLYSNHQSEADDQRGLMPLSTAELQAWQRELDARADWLAARGIRYVVVPVPLAYSIYPEHVPDTIGPPRGPRRARQLIDYMARHSRTTVVDLEQALRAGKPSGRLYHRTDSHWNELGAYWGYRGIIEALRRWYPKLQPAPLSDYELTWRPAPGGALAREIGDADLFPEMNAVLTPRRPREAHQLVRRVRWRTTEVEASIEPTVITRRPGGQVGRVLVMRDSFATALVPLLSEHFGYAYYSWTWRVVLPQQLVLEQRPELVIQEFVTSTLNYLPAPPHFGDDPSVSR